MKRFCLLIIPLLALAACGGPVRTDVPGPLPEDAVPFDYDGHLRFDALLFDTIPARLVFDTGAAGLYVDSTWLAASGYAPQRVSRAFMPGGAGSQMTQVRILYDTLSFRIDTLAWRSDGLVPVMNLRVILGRDADGIVGQRFFRDRCVAFDLRRGYMRGAAADTLESAGFVRLDAERQHDFIYVSARVALDSLHDAEGRFLLDMGCRDAVVLTARAAREAGFDDFSGRKVGYATLSGGVGGAASSCFCRAAGITLGGHAFKNVPVEVSRNESGFLARTDIVGIIGNELLERFDFAIDFVAPALWLRPRADADEAFPFRSPGFSTIDRTDIGPGWIVTGLYEGYAPDGLRQGDTLTRWDGVSAAAVKPDSALRVPGRHRMTILRHGEETEYELETKEIL